jgi:plastocyanin
MRIGRMLAALALGATALSGCAGDDEPVPDAQASSTTTVALTTTAQVAPIVIRDFSFAGLEVKAGSKVLVQNQGKEPHTLTADDMTFNTGQVPPGRNVEFAVPSRTGTFKVKCLVHPTRMTGELKVT